MPETYSSENQEEKELVRRVLKGDEAARDEFCERSRRRLLVTAASLLGYADPEAEDMVQETLVAGLKALPGFEFRSRLHTWLNHICVNLCLKALHKRQRLLVSSGEAVSQILDQAAPMGAEGGSGQALLHLGISKLKGDCRKILALRYDRELAYGAISSELKVPVGTVMSRLARCRLALKEILLKLKRAGHE
jgi:RNA polymerase sigma-70 factor (ECF subfamily)